MPDLIETRVVVRLPFEPVGLGQRMGAYCRQLHIPTATLPGLALSAPAGGGEIRRTVGPRDSGGMLDV
jgi:hypothetical protein